MFHLTRKVVAQRTTATSCATLARHNLQGDQNHYHHKKRSVSTLILLRHGQSQWNAGTTTPSRSEDNNSEQSNDGQARFTGWCDIPLTVRGRVEAVAAGQLMRSRGFKAGRVCIAFASELQRSHETCELALASMAGHEQNTWCSDRIRRDWRLNERHYGAVQGLLKEDADLIAEYGADTIRYWRRSMHGKAPPMSPTHPHWQPPPAPLTESLADCQARVLECWEDSIAPALFEEQGLPYAPDERAIVVVAHSNTIRSLMSYFDQVPEERVPKLHVPNSVPILYRFDSQTRKPLSIKLDTAAGGSHARWMLSAANHQAVRQAVKRGGLLTRALFDAMGATKDLTITGRELDLGVRALVKDGDHPVDCVVLGVAQRVARKLSPDDVLHISDFERLCQEGVDGLSLKHLNQDDYVSEEEYGVY